MGVMQTFLARHSRHNVFLIAEAGTAHAGSLQHAKELIHAAASAGANAVKFQVVFADEILHPESGTLRLGGKRVQLYQKFKTLEREREFFMALKQSAAASNILFFASCFGSRSLQLLTELGVAAHKIASPELTYYDLWRAVLKTQLPVFCSIGMSRSADIQAFMRFLKTNAVQKQQSLDKLSASIALMQCVTCYPSRPSDYNLLTLLTLARTTGMLTGLSDHTPHPLKVPLLAAWLQGLAGRPLILEKHLTLSRSGAGLDDSVALIPQEFAELSTALSQTMQELITVRGANKNAAAPVMRACTQALSEKLINPRALKTQLLSLLGKTLSAFYSSEELSATLGDGVKTLAACEKPYYHTSKRSLIATAPIAAGTPLSHANSAYLRAEQGNEAGLPPDWEEVLRHSTGKGREQLMSAKSITSGAGITAAKLNVPPELNAFNGKPLNKV